MKRSSSSAGVERRKFLKLMGGAAGATVVLGGGGLLLPAKRAGAQDPLTPFVDRLPIMDVIRPDNHTGTPFFSVTMQPFRQKLHRDLPPTSCGATTGSSRRHLRGAAGASDRVKWENDLPSTHCPARSTTPSTATSPAPPVRTVVHLHGDQGHARQ